MEGKFFEFMYNYCPFFHGKISKEEAKKILQGKPDGSFLIRQKESTENSNTQFESAVKLRIANRTHTSAERYSIHTKNELAKPHINYESRTIV